MLKTGPKKLFLLDNKGNQMKEMNPICVLDFYIHESCQRMGLGKILFEHFLEVRIDKKRFLVLLHQQSDRDNDDTTVVVFPPYPILRQG